MIRFKQYTLLLLLVTVTTLLRGQEYERIIRYHSDLFVQKDCSVLIKEKIKVYANGQSIQRGIFREMPLSYEYKGEITM
jgi:hypothetical protein